MVFRFLSFGENMDSAMLYLVDLRDNPLMQPLQVSSQFSINLLFCYLTLGLHSPVSIYLASSFDFSCESLTGPLYISTLIVLD